MEFAYASIDYGRLEQSLIVLLLRLVTYRFRRLIVIAISFSQYILVIDVFPYVRFYV